VSTLFFPETLREFVHIYCVLGPCDTVGMTFRVDLKAQLASLSPRLFRNIIKKITTVDIYAFLTFPTTCVRPPSKFHSLKIFLHGQDRFFLRSMEIDI
jgi:hypothetical protein